MLGPFIFSASSWVNFGNFLRKLCLLLGFPHLLECPCIFLCFLFSPLPYLWLCLLLVPHLEICGSFFGLALALSTLLVFSNNNSWLCLLSHLLFCFLIPYSLLLLYRSLPLPFPRLTLLLFYLASWVECLGEALRFCLRNQGFTACGTVAETVGVQTWPTEQPPWKKEPNSGSWESRMPVTVLPQIDLSSFVKTCSRLLSISKN